MGPIAVTALLSVYSVVVLFIGLALGNISGRERGYGRGYRQAKRDHKFTGDFREDDKL